MSLQRRNDGQGTAVPVMSTLLSWVLALCFVAQGTCWKTISQTSYGAQLSDIQNQMHGSSGGTNIYTRLGWLWTSPANADAERVESRRIQASAVLTTDQVRHVRRESTRDCKGKVLRRGAVQEVEETATTTSKTIQ